MKPLRISKTLAVDVTHIVVVVLAVACTAVPIWQHWVGPVTLPAILSVLLPSLGMIGALMKKSPGDLAKELVDDLTGGGGGGGGGLSVSSGSAGSADPPPKPPASFYAPKRSGIYDMRRTPEWKFPEGNISWKIRLRGFKQLVVIGLVFTFVLTASGCQQIQAAFPQLDKVEQIILNDLAAGKLAEAIELDVAAILAPGKTAQEIVILINDAITLLIDAGVIPPGVIPQARAVQNVEVAKLAAMKLTNAPAPGDRK